MRIRCTGRVDAILTRSGTALADDPHFTVRLVADHPDKQRLLVVLDRRRRVSPDCLAAARRRGLVVHLEGNLHAALAMIGASGAMEVLVEAGPSLTRSVLETALWDELVLIEQAGTPVAPTASQFAVARPPNFTQTQRNSHVFRHH